MDAAADAGRRRRVRTTVAWAAYCVAGIVLVHYFVFTITSMASGSMAPTLRSDVGSPDRVLVDLLTTRLRGPERGEIVYFRDRQGDWVMKRVAGLPGETVEIREGKVLVDGQALKGPPSVAARSYLNHGHMGPGIKVKIDPGHYFVLGDDTADSYDSRFWGCLERSTISGIARAVVWPIAHAAPLTPGD